MWKSLIILTLNLLVLFKYSEAVCGVCNENGIACVSETEFQACFNKTPDTSRTFRCQNPNEVCSKFSRTCVEGAVPLCNNVSYCGKCKMGGFACTSRTTFTMCSGDDELSTVRGSCPPKQICDADKALEGKEFCVSECNLSTTKYCDLNDPIDVTTTTTTEVPTIPTTTTTTQTITTTTPTPTTTTTTPTTTTPTTTPTTTTPTTTTPTTTTPTTTTPTTTITTTPTTTITTTPTTTTTTPTTTTTTTPTTTTTTPTTTTPAPTQNPAVVLCSQQTAVGRYPYPNDTICRSYAYCFIKNNTMQGTPMTCPGEFYFNPTTKICGAAKPQGCI